MAAFDLATTTTEVLGRMLRRLPTSLWDNSPDSSTLQRDVYRAIAQQCAVWLEQRAVARTMTLLLEAEGLDLDVLLQDYGLKRYLQRPDAYARQIGMHCLWTPKETQGAIAALGDLLFDPQAHVTLRTGRNQLHVFLANTQPVTTPYSYWGLVSQQGLWYAVTVDGKVPTISPIPPPGLDVSPGLPTLHWCTVLDASAALWYVTIDGDTLALSRTAPAGTGSMEPFSVLDGHGTRWTMVAEAYSTSSAVLVSVEETGLPGFGYWRLQDPLGIVYRVWMEGAVPTLALAPPSGGSDQTPGGTPLSWVHVQDERGDFWYISVEHDTLIVTGTALGGTGTEALWEILDLTGQRWVFTVDSSEEVVVATMVPVFNADYVVVSPNAVLESVQLFDSADTPWWLAVDGDVFTLTRAMPAGAQDVTPPAGPFRWLRVYDLHGLIWYLFPDLTGVLMAESSNPGGSGTLQPRTLGDTRGVSWHFGVDPGGNATLSNAPPVDYRGMATAVCLHDANGVRWFWRVHGHVVEWSSVLWPDTVDQSPWGSLGWLQVLNEAGALRYVFPSLLGYPMAAGAPPSASPWGWHEAPTLLDLQGTRWGFTVLTVAGDDCVGTTTLLPEDIPPAETPLDMRDVQEVYGHIQAAGSLVTVFLR